MSALAPSDITLILATLSDGDSSAAAELLPVVYEELRGLAAGYFKTQRTGHTLQPTALVHEAFLRVVRAEGKEWKDRAHFFRVAAAAMRHILVNYARDHAREKRGGNWQRVPFDDMVGIFEDSAHDLVALDENLSRLSELDRRMAQVVELRFFGGMSVTEAAEVLGVSERTIKKDWNSAKLWLLREMNTD